MDQFKDNDSYNELDNIYKNNNISLPKNENGSIYNKKNFKTIYNNITNNELILKKISEKQIIENPFEIKEIEIGKNSNGVYYYNEFVIVNREIFGDIRKYYNNNNSALSSKKRDYIINEGRIIIIIDDNENKK